MKFLLNISTIFTHQLIDEEDGPTKLHNYFTCARFVLLLLFIAGWFPGTFGVICDQEHMPRGLMFMTLFSMFWTVFVIYQFRDDEMVKLNKDAFKKIAKNSKEMALSNEKKDFDHEAMKSDQLKMYIIL